MSVAYKYNPRYSLEDYRRWEGDWELIDGVAIAMTPSASGEHQQIGMRLANLIFDQLSAADCEHCLVYYELDWIVDEHTVLRPDLLVTCGGPVAQHLNRAPELVVEILSKSTEEKDRGVKFKIYQQQSVRYYLIVDPVSKSLEVYQLQSGTYKRLPANQHAYTLHLHDDCRIEIAALCCS